jgi:CheY-like chemotaxis protein
MPDMDGLDLIDAIGAEPELAGTAVVLVTDLGQEVDGDPVTGPPVASLSKPIRRGDLRACLGAALGLDTVEPTPIVVPKRRVGSETATKLGRLLLAEDNLINQKVAVAMLTGAGYSVDTVLNGAEAVQAVATRLYDAVLMDCQMPELNGYEATAAIRAQEGTNGRVPIIAMTAGARHEDEERCLAEGMDAYVAKPVSKDTLLSLVARVVTTDRL